MPDGQLRPLELADPPEDIRCSTPARFKPGELLILPDPRTPAVKVRYEAIPDTPGQPVNEPRHCAATKAYAALTADHIAMYQFDSAIRRHQGVRGLALGALSVVPWVLVYWNVYYRALVPIYLRRRERRRRKRDSARLPRR